jgi:AcrR family transcriptional regulator
VKRAAGRPRRAGADEEILAVTLEMLREKGSRELNVDEIAERAGVAKTTVYRRWPSKGAIVAAAIAPLAPRSDGDLGATLRDTVALLNLIIQVDDVEVLRAVIEPQRRRVRELVASDAIADALVGALITRMLLTRAPLDAAIVDELLSF